MKTLNTTLSALVAGTALLVALGAHAQLQFTGARVTSGGAIQLQWASESNAVFRIEYAPEVNDSATAWQTLYEDYPAQGKNTVWTDAGDQNTQTIVGHNKDNRHTG